ncbi:MAG: capsular biosynthesis protein, partial [Pseudoalteromonas sp.]|nr:capsular biosynthesis protein [Pseudoalteromonas sp.]
MDCQLHVMGAPKLSAIHYLSKAFKVDFNDVINAQLKRKRARNNLWNNALVS